MNMKSKIGDAMRGIRVQRVLLSVHANIYRECLVGHKKCTLTT